MDFYLAEKCCYIKEYPRGENTDFKFNTLNELNTVPYAVRRFI